MRGIEQRIRRIEDRTTIKGSYDRLIISGECKSLEEGRCPELEKQTGPIILLLSCCINCPERSE